MKQLTKEQLMTIERQLFNKARDLDVAIYNGLTDELSKEFVLDCLCMYRNNDGGFGNALEIDNYNPHSSVYQTYEALRILDMLDYDSNCEHELYLDLVNKAGNYLYNRTPLIDNKWNPLVPTNNDFAHSEEYEYFEGALNTWGFHPTAAIVGFSLTLFRANKAYYKKALKLLNPVMADFNAKAKLTTYDFISYNSLLGSLKKANLEPTYQKEIEERLLKEAPTKLNDSDFSIAKMLSNCNLTSDLQNKLDLELDELIDSIKSHGLWEHTKTWGSTRFPEADSAMLKWIGAETVNNLWLLKKYGRA